LAGCTSVGPAPENVSALPPVRFLLTFDDGPSGALVDNPTERIVQTLAHNPTQPGIKAVFFVQSRWPGAGGSTVGRRLLQRIAEAGHVLGIHSGTPRGHINHRTMTPSELLASMHDASADIQQLGGESARLVRPPFWAFDDSTLSTYDRAGVAMLLTDLRARDGLGNAWYQVDPENGGRLHRDFRHFLQRLARGQVPLADGVAPVIVTFHDTNHFTAAQLSTYLATLVEVGRAAGMTVADPPFYADPHALRRAAQLRAKNQATRAELAP
jgi:peptidoglycan/xylan/chitin deacetylase (PgdA/CDA1 family)